MSRFDYFEHLDGPQGRFDVSGRVIPGKGGGGGGSGTPYYANMDELYGQQSRAAGFMLDQSMPYIPQYISNSNQMTGEAMDGTLAKRMREQAGNEAQAGLGTALSATSRSLQRSGANFSTNRLLSEGNRNAIMGAATKAGAMNAADANAEDMKWNRNASAFGQVTGMGNGAMQGLGSAAAGYGAAGAAMNANASANAAGYGRFGTAVGNAMFKDGGAVLEGTARRVKELPEDSDGDGAVRLALGGDAWSAWKNQNPVRSGQAPTSGGTGLGSAVGALATGLAPMAIGKGLKTAWNGGLGDAVAKGIGSARGSIEGALGMVGTQAPVEVIDKASKVADLAGAADAATSTEAVGKAIAGDSAIPGLAALSAANDIANGDVLKGGAKLALDYMLPGAGSAVDIVSSFLKDGGEAGRKDMRPGGPVHGKGTETSDSVPAWLSKGEVVNNAESVKLSRDEAKDVVEEWEEDGGDTKDLLLKINDRGLEKRYGKQPAADEPEKKGLAMACGGSAHKKGVKMAGGGFLGGNLGIALGAAADEMARQREMARADKAEERAAQTFARQQKEWATQDTVDANYAEANKEEDPKIRAQKYARADPRKTFEHEAKLREEGQRDRQLAANEEQVRGTLKHYDDLIAEHGKERADKMIIAKMNDDRMRQQLLAQQAMHASSLRAAAERDGKVINATDKDGNLVPVVVKGTTGTPISLPQGLKLATTHADAQKALSLPKPLQDEYDAATLLVKQMEAGLNGGTRGGLGLWQNSDYTNALARQTAAQKAIEEHQSNYGANRTAAKADPMGYSPSAKPKVQQQASDEFSPKELGKSPSGKTLYSWDDYSELRKRTKALEGGGQGAVSPQYFKLKEMLDNADYRTY